MSYTENIIQDTSNPAEELTQDEKLQRGLLVYTMCCRNCGSRPLTVLALDGEQPDVCVCPNGKCRTTHKAGVNFTPGPVAGAK